MEFWRSHILTYGRSVRQGPKFLWHPLFPPVAVFLISSIGIGFFGGIGEIATLFSFILAMAWILITAFLQLSRSFDRQIFASKSNIMCVLRFSLYIIVDPLLTWGGIYLSSYNWIAAHWLATKLGRPNGFWE